MKRPPRLRACIAGCADPVVARCQYRLRLASVVCGVALCENHVGPGTRCPTHAAGVEVAPRERCPSSGFGINGLAAQAGEVYCAGCRVAVPVVDGAVAVHARQR